VGGRARVAEDVGSLPVTADFCRRLGIAEIIDESCPMRDVTSSRVTHGQMVEALIANPAVQTEVDDACLGMGSGVGGRGGVRARPRRWVHERSPT
jgi:hypothetical protein